MDLRSHISTTWARYRVRVRVDTHLYLFVLRLFSRCFSCIRHLTKNPHRFCPLCSMSLTTSQPTPANRYIIQSTTRVWCC
ncbi:hypothetical protein BDN70DRAFT_153085 [Pholiota conissans]|uniref:Uncharacterized protein n=1 Tax=Pholiota conissans TaxID=109636 RepID=A0A9P6CRZ7_9AGAR|nr:hypothetical protein BDN70DRAFT_153085 [Pholiota conissans]